MPNYGFVSPIRVKNGSTDITIASSTGGLYQQGVALPNSTLIAPLANVTWATTGAQTLVNTTSVQELTNKTINNITITDPTSNAAGTLTIANGGSLVTAGAFQHKFTSTANSAVTMPGATDALLMWTTEVDGKITAKTSQINVLSAVTWTTTEAQTLANTTSVQTFTNKTLGAGTISNLETATSDSTLVNYGISVVRATTAGGALTVGLAAPVAGVRKVIFVTANSSDTVTVDATSDVIIGNTTADTYNKILFQCPAMVELIGLSTVQYGILSLGSTAYSGTTTLPSLTS